MRMLNVTTASSTAAICKRSASSSALRDYYDVVVVGGGMVGNAMAASIGANKNLKDSRVLLLDAGKQKSLGAPSEVYSNRVSAVNPSSAKLFKHFGVWERLEKYRVKKVAKLQVLDSCSQSTIDFEQPRLDQEVAFIIENNAIISALYDNIVDNPNIDVCTEMTVDSCNLPEDLSQEATIKLKDGSEISTSLVIGADGARSFVREVMNVDYSQWNYDQKAIVATLKIQGDEHNETAWQRFTPFGPLALLPLTKDLSSLVWTTSPADCERLLALTPEQFVDELNNYLWTDENQNALTNQALFLVDKACSLFGGQGRSSSVYPMPPTVLNLQTDTRAAFPLGFGLAHTYVKPRAAIIGDAAHRIHPLAGQGVNLGWNDVSVLTNVLDKMASQGADFGSVTYLSEYDTISQRHNVPVMVTVDWLNRLYNTSFAPLVFMRSLGLHTVNKLTPFKDLIMYKASG